MTVLTWIFAIFIAFFFIMTGIVKIFGTPKQIFEEQKKRFFDNYGIDRKGIRSIGFGELFGGIAVLFWPSNDLLARTGAIALIIITLGATFFHFAYDEKPAPQAAITMLLLSIGFLVILLLGP